jgi:hypothetical protein
MNSRRRFSHGTVWIFLLIALAGFRVHTRLWKMDWRMDREDIHYIFLEGSRLTEGVNPYERVLQGDMRANDKYATYLPLFYVLSAGTQLAGWKDFPSWLVLWRGVFLAFNLGIGFLIFRISSEANRPWLGIFGSLFWLFNRWTLHVTLIGHIDFVPLFFLLLSLSQVSRRFPLACLLFGLSLAIKQIALFAAPLYWIWALQTGHGSRGGRLLRASGWILLVPFLVSLPFLVWNAGGFLQSILFSATRNPEDHFSTPSLDAIFGYHGVFAKIPMGVLLGLVYAGVWARPVSPYAALLLVQAVFIGFNSVLFRQYVVWLMPFLPLALIESLPRAGRMFNQGKGNPGLNRRPERFSDDSLALKAGIE